MRTLFGGLMATTALLAAPAFAPADEPAAGAEKTLFSQLDANNDGQISSDEVSGDKQRIFERLVRTADKNNDGKLSREEFDAGSQEKRPERPLEQKQPEGAERPQAVGGFNGEELLKRLDKNNDGKITLDEAPEEGKERVEQLIKRADKNGDGGVSREEIAEAFRGGLPQPGQGRPGFPNPEQILSTLDKNSDGKITADEVSDELKEKFAQLRERADKNSDGIVTREELAEAFKNFPGRPEGGPEGRFDPARLFGVMDKNGDGKITADEVPEDRKPMLERGDKDGDKAVSKEEFIALMQSFAGRRPDGERKPEGERRPEGERKPEGERRPDGPPRGEGDRRPDGRPGEGRPPMPGFGLFGLLDTNHDNELDDAEIHAAPDVLRKLDKDGDKKVSIREIFPEGGPRPDFRRPGGPDRPEGGRPEGRRPGGDGDAPRREGGEERKP